MNIQSTGQQAKIYLFDLHNCAREFGFKADEPWELKLASPDEKKAIEKLYYPTISAKVNPEKLVELFNLVTAELKQVASEIINSVDKKNAPRELQYVVAYNPKRPVR